MPDDDVSNCLCQGMREKGRGRNHKEALTDEYKDILLLECYGGESWRVLSSSFFVFVFRRNRIEGKRERGVSHLLLPPFSTLIIWGKERRDY